MYNFSQHKFILQDFWAGGNAAMRRLLPLAVTLVAIGLAATSTGPRAQFGPDVLVRFSEWEIRHGIRDERYNFQANGYYDYQQTVGLQPLAVESGTYSVQDDRLILRPTGGSEKILRWGIGKDDLHSGPILYLTYPDGRQEFYYSDMTHGPQGREIH